MIYLLSLISVLFTAISIYTTPTRNKQSIKNLLLRCGTSYMFDLGVLTCIKDIAGM